MTFYNINNQIKGEGNKDIAVARTTLQAEIIVKVLNYYFDSEHFTRNNAVEMMHKNTSNALRQIADHVEKHEYEAEEIIEYLRELGDELDAQSLTVALADELKINRTIDGKAQ